MGLSHHSHDRMTFAGTDPANQLIAEAHRHFDEGADDAGRALADEALAAARVSNDEALLGAAYLAAGRGRTHGPTEQVAVGVEHLSEAIRCGEAVGDRQGVVAAYRLLAQAHVALGELEPARACLLQHRELAREEGLDQHVLDATADLADLALGMGAFEEAMAEVAAIEPHLLESDSRELWARAIAVRAVALLFLGYVHDPLRLLDQAQRTAMTLQSPALELHIYEQLVPAMLFLGRYNRAAELCERAIALAVSRGETVRSLELQVAAAEVAWRTGDGDRAARLCSEVYQRAAELWSLRTQALACLGLARFALGAERLDEADTLARGGLYLSVSAGNQRLLAELQLIVGEVALRRGELDAAEEAFDEALSAADTMNSPHHRALALFGLGRCAPDIQSLNVLRAQATENLNVYLEQLSAMGKRDFLRHDERRLVLEGPLPVAVPETTTAPEGASFLGFLKMGGQSDPDTLQHAFTLLDDVFGLVTSRLPLEELLRRMNETFLRVSHASRGLVYTMTGDGELKLRDRQISADSLSVLGPDGACQVALDRVRQTGQTVWVMDTLSDPELAHLPEVEGGIRGILCIPLKVNDGQAERVIGCLYGDRQASWVGVSEREVTLLELMAKHISVTLEMRILQDESTRKAHHLEMINSLSRALADTLDLERLLKQALGQVLQITHGEHASIFFGQGEDMTCKASMDRHGQPLADVHVSRSVIARVSRERQPLAILDIGQDEELQAKASLVVRNVRSVMCVPLVRDDQMIGLVYISSSTANKTFNRHDLDLMTAIASQVSMALLNAQAYETIKELNAGLEEKVHARTAELERAYHDLTATQDQLLQNEKLATVGTLASGVAHEINNPLGAILSNAQLLRLDTEDPETLDSLNLIEAGARRCKEIVEALLKYSHLAKNNHEPVNMSALANEALSAFERQLQLAEVEVTADFQSVPPIMGDTKELKQVISNLIVNAMDALHEKHGLTGGRLTVRVARELTGLRLVVKDDGAGMEADRLKRIFDPFFTTTTIGSGTGLGLSVCQRIIERHGGFILVHSAPGEGSTFTVELPVP
jgi:signal transduction histidine kinase/tetratricopeptide (TPR) repeat protein